MNSRTSQQSSNIAKTFVILSMVLLSSCTHLTYTPAESAAEIDRLNARLQTIESLWREAETDLNSCIQLAKDCQPLIRP